jgi:hypothetical protein
VACCKVAQRLYILLENHYYHTIHKTKLPSE